MDAADLLAALCLAIDERRWEDLPSRLHEDFRCRYVHTGEELDRDGWVRLNAEYPDFDRLIVQDLFGARDRAVARCHVTGGSPEARQHFEVAIFVTVAGGLVVDMTEVWTDVDQEAPAGTRPG